MSNDALLNIKWTDIRMILFMIGEVQGLKNCFVSTGYNSEGIEYGAGAGRALAECVFERVQSELHHFNHKLPS